MRELRRGRRREEGGCGEAIDEREKRKRRFPKMISILNFISDICMYPNAKPNIVNALHQWNSKSTPRKLQSTCLTFDSFNVNLQIPKT
uniref:Uncharacterized protein n=1 Tax=Cucumis melo TaxID=3656 RepID=A0A9I9ELA9_CUCME